MGLELFHKVPVEAIEMHFNKQNQPLFQRADLVKDLGIRNIRDNFKELSSHHAHPCSEIEGVDHTNTLGRAKNPHDIFINLDGSIKTYQRLLIIMMMATPGKWFDCMFKGGTGCT